MGTVTKGITGLREALERLYRRYNRRSFIDPDPLRFLYDYDDLRDREVAALVASSLAFGNVKQITRSVTSVLAAMGSSPADFLSSASPAALEKAFSDFKHRWIKAGDLCSLLAGARRIMAGYGSLGSCFREMTDASDEDVVPALIRFVGEMARDGGASCGGLLPSPCRGSACKRLNLFLRWMVRRDRVDPGGWSFVSPAKLLVPLDTHMFNFSRALGLTGRRQADLKTAREVTGSFREIAPEDPVRYDFALTRLGIRRDEDRDEIMQRLGIG